MYRLLAFLRDSGGYWPNRNSVVNRLEISAKDRIADRLSTGAETTRGIYVQRILLEWPASSRSRVAAW